MAFHDEFEPDALTGLIGHIYESAANPAHWNEFLAALETYYPGARLTLFGHERHGRPTMIYHHNYATDDLQPYLDYYVLRSPYIGRDHMLETGKPSFYEVMVPDDELKKTEIYNDYVRPRRLACHGTGVVIDRGPGRLTVLSIVEHEDNERRRRQLRLLGLLAPHLLRAIRMQRLTAPPQPIGSAAGGAFDQWDRAAFVLDDAGRVVVMNRLATELTNGRHGVTVGADGQVASFDRAATDALRVAIRRCAAIAGSIDAAAAPPSLDGITLPRPNGATPFRVLLSPLPFLGRAGGPDAASATVLLVIVDPDQARRVSIAHIARQFGLTRAEQLLAEAIINGLKVAEAATMLGIRESTARSRLKDIQAKTHCRRQVDLIRLAHNLPVSRPDDP